MNAYEWINNLTPDIIQKIKPNTKLNTIEKHCAELTEDYMDAINENTRGNYK